MRNRYRALTWIAAWVAGVGIAGTARGALITPAGLGVGETYQLAFVTSGTTNATSADIASYNVFVQDAAEAAGMGAVTWRAIASTMTVDASSNAMVSTRVYNMNGELVANGFADFWDGSHANAIDYSENNVGRNFNVWTGTEANGASGGAGDALGESTPLWGESTFLSGGWTAHGGNTSTTSYALYALSEVITVVPEPVTMGVVGMLGVVVGLGSQRRRRRGDGISPHPAGSRRHGG